MLSYYLSLRAEFRVVMSVAISAYKRCLIRLYLQLFVEWLKSYLRYVCLFAYSGVLGGVVVFVLCPVYPMLSVSSDCPFFIAPPVFSFSNVYKYKIQET